MPYGGEEPVLRGSGAVTESAFRHPHFIQYHPAAHQHRRSRYGGVGARAATGHRPPRTRCGGLPPNGHDGRQAPQEVPPGRQGQERPAQGQADQVRGRLPARTGCGRALHQGAGQFSPYPVLRGCHRVRRPTGRRTPKARGQEPGQANHRLGRGGMDLEPRPGSLQAGVCHRRLLARGRSPPRTRGAFRPNWLRATRFQEVRAAMRLVREGMRMPIFIPRSPAPAGADSGQNRLPKSSRRSRRGHSRSDDGDPGRLSRPPGRIGRAGNDKRPC